MQNSQGELFGVVGDEGEDFVVGEFLAAVEEGELDEEGDGDDFSAEALDEGAGSGHGTAGG